MTRFALCIIQIGALTLPAFAQTQGQVQRPNVLRGQQNQLAIQNQQDPTVQARLQNQMRTIIADLYVRKFSQALELTDEQFLRTTFFIRSFIENRFMAAMRRENINRQLEALQSQPNPSKEAVDDLVAGKAVLDSNVGGMQSQFLTKIRPELTTQQVLAFISFNEQFFKEELPNLIERAREAAPQGRQNQNIRPNRGLQQGNSNR